MKKLLIAILLLSTLYSAYIASSAATVTPPSNCIQYTDECGNMCIKKRNGSRSCNKVKSCTIYQQYMCVAIVNDVDLDENKNKIIKQKYIPQPFWTLFSNNGFTNNNSNNNTSNIVNNSTTWLPELYSPDLKGSTASSSTWANFTYTQVCNNEDKPVCGMIPLICERAPCFPIIQNYKNECAAKAEWALYIQPWVCTVKNNMKK